MVQPNLFDQDEWADGGDGIDMENMDKDAADERITVCPPLAMDREEARVLSLRLMRHAYGNHHATGAVEIFDHADIGESRKAEGQAKMDRKAYAPLLDALLLRFLEFTSFNEFTADTLRNYAMACKEEELLTMAHPNSWGALFTRSGHAGLICGTGRYISSQNKSRHSGKIQVWQRTEATTKNE